MFIPLVFVYCLASHNGRNIKRVRELFRVWRIHSIIRLCQEMVATFHNFLTPKLLVFQPYQSTTDPVLLFDGSQRKLDYNYFYQIVLSFEFRMSITLQNIIILYKVFKPTRHSCQILQCFKTKSTF